MKINRKDLVTHLHRISCGGQIKEVVFRDGLATSALTADHLLLVEVPSLKGAGKLLADEEVGVPELGTFIRALGFESEDEVDIRLQDKRLVIGEEHGETRLVTSEPRTIVTTIGSDVVENLLEKIGDQEISLPPELVARVRNRFSGLSAEEVVLSVGKKGGSIQVGAEHGHMAELPVPALKAKTPYELLFGSHLISVLSTLREEKAVMKLSGPGGVIAVEDGEYRYLLSPRSRAAAAAPKADSAEDE